MFIGTTGHSLYSATSGVNTVSNETITFEKKDLTCYLQLQFASSNGYADAFVVNAAGQEIFTTRLQTYQSINNGYTQTAGNMFQFNGVQIACICSGFANFTHVRIRCRKGALAIGGLGFATEYNVPTTPHALVHSDNVVGSPSSLSDERIKNAVTPLDADTCLDAVLALSPSMYVRTDPGEESVPRLGLIAQEVKQVCEAFAIPTTPLISNRLARVSEETELEELLGLDYARLNVLLLGAVQKLTARVAQLTERVAQFGAEG